MKNTPLTKNNSTYLSSNTNYSMIMKANTPLQSKNSNYSIQNQMNENVVLPHWLSPPRPSTELKPLNPIIGVTMDTEDSNLTMKNNPNPFNYKEDNGPGDVDDSEWTDVEEEPPESTGKHSPSFTPPGNPPFSSTKTPSGSKDTRSEIVKSIELLQREVDKRGEILNEFCRI